MDARHFRIAIRAQCRCVTLPGRISAVVTSRSGNSDAITIRSIDEVDDRDGIGRSVRDAEKIGRIPAVSRLKLELEFDDSSWTLMGGLFMDHFVKLDKLPDGYQFPPDLEERIYFDAAAHKLVFRGYMSKADFDRLSQRTKDWGFRRSLEELFRLSVPEIDPSTGRRPSLPRAFTKLFSPK